MGARHWISRMFKRSRSLSGAIFVASMWLCLITVINFESNSQPGISDLKGESHLLVRSNSLASFLALRELPIVDKRTQVKQATRNDLKSSVTNLQQGTIARGNGQTSALVKNRIISGRRIQEIKYVQIGGSDALSRRYDSDQADGHTNPSKSVSVLISDERAQIDNKAITGMEIRQDVQTLATILGDLRSNWTPEPLARAFHFSFPGIPERGRSQTREESKPGPAISSRAKNSQSKSDSSDRKTRSQDSEMPAMMVKYGFEAQEKSISGHFSQNIGEMRNRQSNFYDSRGTINTHLNGAGGDEAREKKVNKNSDNSPAISLEAGYPSRTDPRTNSGGATNKKFFRETRPKSNLRTTAGMQINVPERGDEFSSSASIDHNVQQSRARINSSVKYPVHFSAFGDVEDRSNTSMNGADSIPTSETKRTSHALAGGGSKLNSTANKLTAFSNEDDGFGRLSATAEKDLEAQAVKLTVTNASGSNSGIGGDPGIKDIAQSRILLPETRQAGLKYDGFELYSYNVTASNALPLNRSIPDTRPPGCEQLPAYSTPGLPRATVIICFHNEALSVLLRTVHSILDRTPPHLLDKIILVDDFSSQGDLSLELAEALTPLGQVFLTRTTKREGLVRARLLGSRLAVSEVIIFLDAHCECNVGWLEPLLFTLSLDPKKVVSPYIDTIKSESFHYKCSPAQLQGGFSWRLEFGWRAATGAGRLLNETQPITTPVISGGLFAVQRDYFTSMGGYDPELNIWGGENFELSFKTWMCGGSVEIVPCSRVGHVFRALLPYTFTGDRQETVLRNLARVASVWMDEYADIFFAAVNLPDNFDIGDMQERAKLRKNLHCRSFKWYLDKIFPQLDIVSPDITAYGQVRNKGSLMCFDVMRSTSGFYLGLSPCHNGRNQTFHLTTDNQLKQGDACITPGINKQLTLSKCRSHIKWIYKRERLNLSNTNLCVTSVDNAVVHLLPCTEDDTTTVLLSSNGNSFDGISSKYDISSTSLVSSSFQQWTFDYSFNWKRRRRRNV